MLPRYSTSDVRFETVERELHINEIKANKCRVWPLARGINGPHANLWRPLISSVETEAKNDEPHSLGPRLVVVDSGV